MEGAGCERRSGEGDAGRAGCGAVRVGACYQGFDAGGLLKAALRHAVYRAGRLVSDQAMNWWDNDPVAPVAEEWWKNDPVEMQPTALAKAPSFDPLGNPVGFDDEGRPDGSTIDRSRLAKIADDTVRAVAHGATFGFADRMAAAAEAATGIGGKGGDYAGNFAAERARTAAQEPGATVVGNVAGALAVPVGGAARLVAAAPGALGKITASGALGAGMGAVQGVGDAPDLTDTVDVGAHVAQGAKYGGVIGAALPGVAAGVGAGYRALAGRTHLPDGVNAIAAERLAKAAQADREGVENLSRLGPEALLADAGPSLQGLAQGVATKPGEGRTTLVQALRTRNEGTNARIGADVESALGPAQSPNMAAEGLKARRTAIHEELPAVFEQAPPVDTRAALAFVGAKLDKAVGPERAALLKAREYLMEGGPTGLPMPVANAEKLANAKIALSSLVEHGDPSIGVTPGALAKAEGVTKRTIGLLDDALRRQVPGYASVMDRSSNMAKAIDGIERGQGLLKSGEGAIRPDDFARALGKATSEETASMRVGARASIDRALGTKANDLQALRQELQGEGGWNQAKLAMLFGEDPAAALAATVDRNAQFRSTYGKVVEGSKTAETAAAGKELDAAVAPVEPKLPKSTTAVGLALNTAETVLRKIAQGQADFAGEKTRANIAKVLAMPAGPQRETILMQLLKRADIVDAAGQRIGNAAALLTGAGALSAARQ